ncbi:heparan-alpha-glucosaminide N-acetyltransferase [Enterovirga rhinocerotis]|uniref:Putative membrane protein n=1 Tax=Enterovirga rhinocerotis TaxID=1339210 RepID=A0A4R7C4I6_9HYPH|nr:heparan-alpha-glucosaminide N-acetyltransferase [Enterovirga rhinocerotis]TDR93288.1 putative membrane protein [Enterovirga rhinocerotis]
MIPVTNTELEGRARSAPRIPAIDIARGLAVVAMVVYHTAWDLSTLALVDLDVTGSREWNLFARSIAASFLVLVGIGLVLAHGDGIRWPHFLRRVAVIATGALAITAATAFFFPSSYIFFGILHNIALSSLIAVPFLALPPLVTAAVGLAMLYLPTVVAGGVFDTPILAFLGLGRIPPVTYDWVPVVPWTGYVLAGIAVARLVAGVLPRGEGGRIGRLFATLGRYSLVIYLLHQPLIFGALFGVQKLVGPNPRAEIAPFVRDCTQTCTASGQEEGYCRSRCERTVTCTADALRREGIWAAVRDGTASAEFRQRAGNRHAECLKKTLEGG